MQTALFRPEEKTAMIIALALHLALLAALVLQMLFKLPPAPPEEERVTVSLATEVGLEATAPEPVAESRAAIAPIVSENPEVVSPPPLPQPESRPRPQSPIPTPNTNRTRREEPKRERTNQESRRRPDRPQSKPSSTPSQSSGSRIGSDFLGGAGSSTTTDDTRIPASQIGASAKASLLQALARQLKPHWSAPDGADADKLYTMVSFRLNEDGSLAGSPSCKPTQGVTDSNRPQAERHCDYAIRAVRRAAPFNLPDEYYNAWKSVRDFKFSGTL